MLYSRQGFFYTMIFKLFTFLPLSPIRLWACHPLIVAHSRWLLVVIECFGNYTTMANFLFFFLWESWAVIERGGYFSAVNNHHAELRRCQCDCQRNVTKHIYFRQTLVIIEMGTVKPPLQTAFRYSFNVLETCVFNQVRFALTTLYLLSNMLRRYRYTKILSWFLYPSPPIFVEFISVLM